MFRGEDGEAAWNYFQAGLSIQMLCPRSKVHLSCSLLLSSVCVFAEHAEGREAVDL